MKWVLLRGLGREAAHWLEFLPMMENEFGSVLALDLPGFGERSHQSSPMKVSEITDLVRADWLQQSDDTKKDCHILGISLGGMVALDWVHRFPDDFKSAVVINTSSKDSGPIWQRLTVFGLYKMLQSLKQINDPLKKQKTLLEMISNTHVDNPEVLQKLVDIERARPVSLKNVGQQILAASQFMAPSSVSVPVLMLASLKDHMVDVRCTRLLSERLKTKAKFHPEAGHELTLDDPSWVVQQVRQFINDLEAPSEETKD